jgi:hypothetical protein
MATWKIKLENVGPDKAGETFVVEAQNLVKAKVHAVRACRRHLPSGSIYLEAEGHYRYLVIHDMDECGVVQMTCLDARTGHRSQRPQVQASQSLT